MNPDQPNELVPLETQAPDYVASAAKAVLGAVPFAGSLLAEIAGTIIPNQRVDRLAKFAAVLELKLAHLQQDFVRSKLTDENFTDLLEESIRQAARAVTNERHDYIASLVATGIGADSIQFIESKHLIRILGEINDIEVLWLRFHLVSTIGGDKLFREKHTNVFNIPPAVFRAPQEILDKNALKNSYLQHLAQLGLLSPRYHTDMRTMMPEFDSFTGGLKVWYYHLTPLGKLLLRYIGLSPVDKKTS